MRLLFVLLIVSCAGCKTLITKKYQLNRQMPFHSKTEYLRYLSSEYGFLAENLLSIDSASFYEYLSKGLNIYVGTFINDSVQYAKSPFLKDNQACMGRIEKELKAIQANERSSFDSSIRLKDLGLKYANNRQSVNVLSNKKSIVLINYSYALGTYYDKLYKEFVASCQNNKDFELYVISMDWLYHLPD